MIVNKICFSEKKVSCCLCFYQDQMDKKKPEMNLQLEQFLPKLMNFNIRFRLGFQHPRQILQHFIPFMNKKIKLDLQRKKEGHICRNKIINLKFSFLSVLNFSLPQPPLSTCPYIQGCSFLKNGQTIVFQNNLFYKTRRFVNDR